VSLKCLPSPASLKLKVNSCQWAILVNHVLQLFLYFFIFFCGNPGMLFQFTDYHGIIIPSSQLIYYHIMAFLANIEQVHPELLKPFSNCLEYFFSHCANIVHCSKWWCLGVWPPYLSLKSLWSHFWGNFLALFLFYTSQVISLADINMVIGLHSFGTWSLAHTR